MSYKHACFVSYVQGQGVLMQEFMGELTTALFSELEPFVDEDVFVDRTHIAPGTQIDLALAKAICQSASWLVVYVPKYGRHEWCRREFRAMVKLEAARRAALGASLPDEWRMCIPIILRGEITTLPDEMRGPLVADFSRYMTAESSIVRNREYVAQMMRIAEHIGNLCTLADDMPGPLETLCTGFKLPPADAPWGSVRPWLPTRSGP